MQHDVLIDGRELVVWCCGIEAVRRQFLNSFFEVRA